METRVLEYFLKVAQLGNVSKAARQLHVTQPNLSRQIQKLEKDLNVQLFERQSRLMVLTSAGKIFQERAKQIIDLSVKAQRDVLQENDLRGEIAIGCVESKIVQLLSQAIVNFQEIAPNVKFSLYDADCDDIREKIDNGLLDLGFLLAPVEAAKYEQLKLGMKDYWGIVVPDNSSWAQKKGLSLTELADLPLIVPRRTIVKEEIVSWLNHELNIVGSQNLLSNTLPLVMAGWGYAMCSAGSFVERPAAGLTFVPIQPAKEIDHLLIWRKNFVMTPAVKAFVKSIKEIDCM
ncbi:LysR family transcriptional regulator [Xylocopilactobacillus apicola]|uniref:LysR family transcriptional regulator n=1 Tax=Xylocopilactobacillus apicola TaxID=2932184 RepID=A0AAU9DAF0_9LACO|nr:LysR family transcriptional regulator [Xylocopilactobacillus apicola]BDR59360.1 LysR family transcriptional regulator [Xylocopilactobacillus apicola]